jgi:hypothetical protein
VKKKLYLFSILFLSLILLSSLLYSLHLRGRVAKFEKRLSELAKYTSSPEHPKNSDPSENNLPSEYRQAIEEFINNNIEDLVKEEHMMGGRWIVTNLKFLSPSKIQLEYEDGHNVGRLVLAIDELKVTDVKYHVSESGFP